ncbi:unnamed protein product [Polarella glacialis]|uniref:Uncharacterized protein n=1 Tax=Polarella glacialis TaxID=89957 RepID=A0A813FCR5_POLGL|nr:unnamed protein product [Polarella glacialis]
MGHKHLMPLTVMGSGRTSWHHKLAALLHVIILEAARSKASLTSFFVNVIGMVTDMGTERLLGCSPRIDITEHLTLQALESGVGPLPPLPPLIDQPEVTGAAVIAAAAGAAVEPAQGAEHRQEQWSILLPQLRSVEKIVGNVQYRERYQATCLSADQQHLLSSWSSSLKSLRWHAVGTFLSELLDLETLIRRTWSKAKFLSQKTEGARAAKIWDDSENLRDTVNIADKCFRSDHFWSSCVVCKQICFLAEYISSWSEGCPVHDVALRSGFGFNPRLVDLDTDISVPAPAHADPQHSVACCWRKGCRAPEMAASFTERMLPDLLEVADRSVKMVLASSPLEPQVRFDLHEDWTTAKARLQVELRMRNAYWKLLPWALCGVAHDNIQVARECARNCLSLWESCKIKHRVARRFLDPEWTGSADDPPLVQELTAFAFGADVSSLSSSFQLRVASFRLIRIVERSVEGWHSLINKVRKRAPNANPAYLSLELRMKEFEQTLLRNPHHLPALASEYQSICTLAGWTSAVLQLLGCSPHASPNMPTNLRDLAKLIYRDDLNTKHAAHNHVKQAIANHEGRRRASEPKLPALTMEPEMLMLLDHLRSACSSTSIYSIPRDMFRAHLLRDNLTHQATAVTPAGQSSLALDYIMDDDYCNLDSTLQIAGTSFPEPPPAAVDDGNVYFRVVQSRPGKYMKHEAVSADLSDMIVQPMFPILARSNAGRQIVVLSDSGVCEMSCVRWFTGGGTNRLDFPSLVTQFTQYVVHPQLVYRSTRACIQRHG